MIPSNVHPVILCGGRGTRLWPSSRRSFPKQFSRLMDQDSLLQATVRRLEDCGCVAPILMTSQDYRFIVAEQMTEIGARDHTILIEPEGRNTAPASRHRTSGSSSGSASRGRSTSASSRN